MRSGADPLLSGSLAPLRVTSTSYVMYLRFAYNPQWLQSCNDNNVFLSQQAHRHHKLFCKLERGNDRYKRQRRYEWVKPKRRLR